MEFKIKGADIQPVLCPDCGLVVRSRDFRWHQTWCLKIHDLFVWFILGGVPR